MTITTEKIWNEFHRELLRFIMKRVKDADSANDLLQDIFVKIHLKLHTLSDTEKLTSWVFTITRNSLNDYFRKFNTTTALNEQLPEAEVDASLNAEFAHCLKPLLSALPKDYRIAIEETELKGVPQKDYASNCGLSYSGAKSRVQRGRQQLRQMMTDCCRIHYDKYGNIFDFEQGPDCKFC
ncbi:MAG: RNA polymerase sigma factor SigZ [Flavobacteriales bacterium]